MADSSNSLSHSTRQRFTRSQRVVDSDDKGQSDAPVRQPEESEASRPSEEDVSEEGDKDVQEPGSDLVDEEDNVKEDGDEHKPEDDSPRRQAESSRKRKTLQRGTGKASQADIDSPSISESEPAAKRTRTTLRTPSTQALQRKKIFGGLDLPTDEESDPIKGVYWDKNLSHFAKLEEKLRQRKFNSRSVECPMSFLETSFDSIFDTHVPDDQKTPTVEMCVQKKKAHLPKLREGGATSRGAAHRFRMLGQHNSKYDVNMLLGQNDHIRNDEIIVTQIFEYVENFYNNYASERTLLLPNGVSASPLLSARLT
ncbi:hypothetical protein PRZ48_010435 [Zasmidium cellare]|uniref:Uncharacterized protein n=1 Tax=Zasmidium cellare TaxID=395010 RepID=A0ABR0E8M3_ZASCE|nr:hypothetical protein PRZ48_010435 [Zasmidium cellare]